MDLDSLLSLGKRHQRIIEDMALRGHANMKRRILDQLNEPSPVHEAYWIPKTSRSSHKRRMGLIGAFCVLPLLFGFAGYKVYEQWSGTTVAKSNQNEGPASLWADPTYLNYELGQPNTEMYSLSEASIIAGIPLHAPVHISSWKNIFSRGLVFEQKGYRLLKNHKLKLVHIGHTPLIFVDIYENSKGQRIAVSQQIQSMMTIANRQLGKDHHSEVNPTLEVGADWKVLTGFPNGLVYWVSGNWSDLPGKQAFQGQYENVVGYIRVPNGAVKEVDIGEYGNVDKSQLLAFARAYMK
ncbi:MAG: hypothetical protein K6T83_01315 [Alicyclobacillus sp.]|nr:hypothetical protein [Alicyclobacillus sp.]